MLLAKLLLTPAIVVLATLAGRRFGRVVSGWLIGLPLTSGPVTAFFAVEHGRPFAARSAVGSLGGAIGEVAFCLGYATAARRRGWPAAVTAGSLCFAAVAVVLEAIPLDAHHDVVVALATAAAASLVTGLLLLPHVPPRLAAAEVLPSRWELPARAVTATCLLLALTALATTFGARLSGLLAVYPLYTVVIAAFTQRLDGAGDAVQLLRGLMVGLFSFVCFYTTLAIALGGLGTTASFALAFAVALGVQAGSGVTLRLGARSSADRATAF